MNLGDAATIEVVIQHLGCIPGQMSVQWMKDGSLISDSAKYAFKVYSLVVRDVEPTDLGNYTIFVSGNGVELSKLVHVSALIKPALTTLFLKEETVTTLDDTMITCSASGSPTPLVTWYKNTERIEYDGNHFQLQSSPGQLTLIIRSFNASDDGVYQCSASNAVGLVIGTTYLTAKGVHACVC